MCFFHFFFRGNLLCHDARWHGNGEEGEGQDAAQCWRGCRPQKGLVGTYVGMMRLGFKMFQEFSAQPGSGLLVSFGLNLGFQWFPRHSILCFWPVCVFLEDLEVLSARHNGHVRLRREDEKEEEEEASTSCHRWWSERRIWRNHRMWLPMSNLKSHVKTCKWESWRCLMNQNVLPFFPNQ